MLLRSIVLACGLLGRDGSSGPSDIPPTASPPAAPTGARGNLQHGHHLSRLGGGRRASQGFQPTAGVPFAVDRPKQGSHQHHEGCTPPPDGRQSPRLVQLLARKATCPACALSAFQFCPCLPSAARSAAPTTIRIKLAEPQCLSRAKTKSEASPADRPLSRSRQAFPPEGPCGDG